MEQITSWAQVSLCLAGAMALVIWAIGHLFKSMTTGYGSIINALQAQNTKQQIQLDAQARQVDSQATAITTLEKNHSECEKRHSEMVTTVKSLKDELDQLRQHALAEANATIAALKEEVEHLKNSDMVQMTQAVQDLSQKVDLKGSNFSHVNDEAKETDETNRKREEKLKRL